MIVWSVLQHLLSKLVDAVVNALEKLVSRFFSHQTQGGAFGNHVVEPMFSDFVEISVVGSDEIEGIVSDITRLVRVRCKKYSVIANHQF
jgi:hypothetical protein